MAKIKTLIPFTTIIDGEYLSPRKGEIIEVSDEQAEEYIADGLAEAYTLITPEGSITLTANGEADVTAYATAVVSIPVYDGTVESGGGGGK